MQFSISQLLLGPRLVAVLMFGFASGLPLSLTGATLQAWMTIEGQQIATIAWFSWIGLPYALKFLWSPLMDRYVPPLLGRRRGWILVTQFALLLGIAGMASTSPSESLWFLRSEEHTSELQSH